MDPRTGGPLRIVNRLTPEGLGLPLGIQAGYTYP